VIRLTKNDKMDETQLIKLQAGSGLIFSSFLGIHLANSFIANLGPLGYDEIKRLLRLYYQNPVIEIGLFSSLFVHQIVSGIRIYRRLKQKKNHPKHDHITALDIHRYAGLVIGTVVLVHVFFTRIPHLIFKDDSDFTLITFTLKTWPYFFYPYYIVFSISGLYHLMYGFFKALRVFGLHKITLSTNTFNILFSAGALTLFSAVLAFSGIYFPVPIEHEARKQRFYEIVLPSFLHFALPWLKK